MINGMIVENVGGYNIEIYLKEKGFRRADEDRGIPVADWVNKLIEARKLNVDEFEEFLFNELLYGKRKLIRVYKLGDVKKIKYPDDWLGELTEKYGVDSLSFNEILQTYVNPSENRKIAAIHSKQNDKGELTRLQILFVCHIETYYGSSYAYIPVDIDFLQKVMYIKAWNKQGIVYEGSRAEAMLDHIANLMLLNFKVTYKYFVSRHKKVLYNMSKGLVDEIYNKIPAFSEISVLNKAISDFEQKVFSELPIYNVEEDANGKLVIPKGVMEFSDEIKKAVERLAISDYFFDRRYDEIWDMGVDAIIARIKFNDMENILTSLSGEGSIKPIFCSKTFMYLKKSMEDIKLVEKLWVIKSRNKGKLDVRYDASNEEYLELLIRSNIRYTENDLNTITEMYNNYESGIVNKITGNDRRNVG